MKILIMLVMLIFGNAAFAGSDKEELFSPQQNNQIVKAIDYICGDIWCEGYYDYKFISLSCDKNNRDCELSFQFKESFDDRRVQYSPVQVCQIKDVSSFDHVMEDDQYLNFGFINKLNDCFEELAERYYHGR